MVVVITTEQWCPTSPREDSWIILTLTMVDAVSHAFPPCLAAGVRDRHVGQWEGSKLYSHASTQRVFWQQSVPHPLAAYGGRRIASLSLMPHQGSYRLTVTLAPPAVAATAPAAAAHGAGPDPHMVPAQPAAWSAAAAGASAGVLTTASAPPGPPPPPADATAAATQQGVFAAAVRTGDKAPPGSQASPMGGVMLPGGSVLAPALPTAQGPEAAAPAAVADAGLLVGQAGSGPAVPPAGPLALLPLKRPAAALQQPATAKSQDATAAGPSSKKPWSGRLAKQQHQFSTPSPASGVPAGTAASNPQAFGATSPPALSAPQAAAAAPPQAAGGAGQPGAAAAVGLDLLPSGLQLPGASSAAAMEKHLTRFMAIFLQPLLPPEQYSRLMGQLEKAFRPYRLAVGGTGSGGGAAGPSPGGQLEQLQVMYLYLQAAVVGR